MEQDLNIGGTSIADLAGYDAANKVLAVRSKGSNGLSFLKIAPDGNSSIINQVSLGERRQPRGAQVLQRVRGAGAISVRAHIAAVAGLGRASACLVRVDASLPVRLVL